jgi:hypothetical protein
LNPIEKNRKTAFIIGNGKSRAGLDLNVLRPYGTIFGCNALYRHFTPDYLVAIDDGMIHEIENSEFPKDRFIVPDFYECFEPVALHPSGKVPRSNAGMNAMLEAIRRDHDQLILIGFDFIVASEDLCTGNMYKGTVNYGPETHCSFADSANRMRFLNWFIDQNKEVKFIFTIPKIEGNITMWEFATEQEVFGVEIDTLEDLLKTAIAK